MAKVYLSWEVVVRQFGKKGEIRWQMWHNIMSMYEPNCVWYIFGKIGSKNSIANTRLSESHELNIVTSKTDLWTKFEENKL